MSKNHFLSFIVLTILANKFVSSRQSLNMWSNSVSFKYPVLERSSNQYSVSYASFNAMCILAVKSFGDCPPMASRIFAPMLVPLFRSCFERTYSLCVLVMYLYRLTMRTAKFKLFVRTILSGFTLIFHF